MQKRETLPLMFQLTERLDKGKIQLFDFEPVVDREGFCLGSVDRVSFDGQKRKGGVVCLCIQRIC